MKFSMLTPEIVDTLKTNQRVMVQDPLTDRMVECYATLMYEDKIYITTVASDEPVEDSITGKEYKNRWVHVRTDAEPNYAVVTKKKLKEMLLDKTYHLG